MQSGQFKFNQQGDTISHSSNWKSFCLTKWKVARRTDCHSGTVTCYILPGGQVCRIYKNVEHTFHLTKQFQFSGAVN